jgi:hypothetical protein
MQGNSSIPEDHYLVIGTSRADGLELTFWVVFTQRGSFAGGV